MDENNQKAAVAIIDVIVSFLILITGALVIIFSFYLGDFIESFFLYSTPPTLKWLEIIPWILLIIGLTTIIYSVKRLVDNISFSIEPGKILGILGPSGSGKSTTVKVLIGEWKPDYGSAFIGPYDMQHYSKEIKQLLGYVPQDYALFPHLSVEQNITFGLRAHGYVETNITETSGNVNKKAKSSD